MAMTYPTTHLLTVDELEALGPNYQWYELIDGVLRERGTMGGRHGEIGGAIFWRLGATVFERHLGRVYTSDTRFIIARDPETVLIPDISFVRTDRLPPTQDREGPMPLAPDLVVEIVSPNDRYNDVVEKIEKYQTAGVPLVWLVVPRRRTVMVYATGQEPRTLTEADTLDGGNVVPGFQMPVAEMFR
jgi:Uma2 family endonuclease